MKARDIKSEASVTTTTRESELKGKGDKILVKIRRGYLLHKGHPKCPSFAKYAKFAKLKGVVQRQSR